MIGYTCVLYWYAYNKCEPGEIGDCEFIFLYVYLFFSIAIHSWINAQTIQQQI